MNLTEHFSLEEMLESETAKRYNIEEQSNPPDEVVKNLTKLCIYLLEPIRKILGPIHISSGWRCPKLNKLVGGVPNSQHVTGEAADAEFYGEGGNQAIIDKVKELNLPFDQMIDESNLRWVHISYSERAGNRKQVLKI
jgi:zinc D-Ala-D-Ala carboxypeptidase